MSACFNCCDADNGPTNNDGNYYTGPPPPGQSHFNPHQQYPPSHNYPPIHHQPGPVDQPPDPASNYEHAHFRGPNQQHNHGYPPLPSDPPGPGETNFHPDGGYAPSYYDNQPKGPGFYDGGGGPPNPADFGTPHFQPHFETGAPPADDCSQPPEPATD